MKVVEINLGDEVYPKQLLTLERPPRKLYAIGNLNLLKEDLFSVVGTRNITEYGLKYGEQICKELVLRDIPLVSRFSHWNRYFSTQYLPKIWRKNNSSTALWF